MKHDPFPRALWALIALLMMGAPVLHSEDTPPPAPAATSINPPAAVEAAKAETAPAPASPSVAPAPTPAANESSPPSDELRRLDAETKTGSQERSGGRRARAHETRRHQVDRGQDNAKVSIGHDSVVAKDERVDAAVSILGSTTVDGATNDPAVSVMGNTTVNGSTGGPAVSVFGTTTVNGPVGDVAVAVLGDTRVNARVNGDVVAVMGNVDLGPKAVVRGQVVVVGGTLHRDPAAVVRGGVQAVSFPGFGWLSAWVKSALFKVRLLSFAPAAAWAWLVAAGFLVFYALIALIFPRGVEKCAETLEQRPGFSILAALLTMLALPLVFVLLAITGVGALVIPFLAVALAFARLFGRVAMLAWLGRRITSLWGHGRFGHVAMAVLVGGLAVMVLYLVPVLAFLVHGLIGVLGLGVVVYALILAMRRYGAKPAVAVAGAGGPTAVTGTALAAGPIAAETPAPGAAAVVPPIISAVTLPRAGFWIRLLALGIDTILVLFVVRILPWVHVRPGLCLFLLAIYGAILWKLRGTTVGGSICHLKVVRLDDRPLDWTAAIVRVLSCLLSLAVIGLGFIWVAFDNDKQSWHDKIVGTVVVKVPKGISLI